MQSPQRDLTENKIFWHKKFSSTLLRVQILEPTRLTAGRICRPDPTLHDLRVEPTRWLLYYVLKVSIGLKKQVILSNPR